MARPRKDKEALEKKITIRVPKKTYEQLQDVAQAAGLNISDVMRRRAEGVKIPDRKDMELFYEVMVLRQAIIKQGGLIKHLYNQNPFEPELTRSMLQKQESAFEKVNHLLDRMEEKLNDSENNGRTQRRTAEVQL